MDYDSVGFFYSEDTWNQGGSIQDYWSHERDEKWTWIRVSNANYNTFKVEEAETWDEDKCEIYHEEYDIKKFYFI